MKKVLLIISLTILVCIFSVTFIGCNFTESVIHDEISTDSSVFTPLDEPTTFYDADGIRLSHIAFTESGHIERFELINEAWADAIIFDSSCITDFPGFEPKVMIADITYDGILDVIIKCVNGNGTGIHIEELFIFDGFDGRRIEIEPAHEYADSVCAVDRQSKSYALQWNSGFLDVPYAQFDGIETLDYPIFGNYYTYELLFNKFHTIYCDVRMCFNDTATAYSIEYLRVHYAYDGEKLYCSAIEGRRSE